MDATVKALKDICSELHEISKKLDRIGQAFTVSGIEPMYIRVPEDFMRGQDSQEKQTL